jgi:hypothetical protein
MTGRVHRIFLEEKWSIIEMQRAALLQEWTKTTHAFEKLPMQSSCVAFDSIIPTESTTLQRRDSELF